MTAQVLNGEVTEGDRVAYASVGYSKRPCINLGVIDRIFEKNGKIMMRIRVEYSNTWTGGDRWSTIEARDRVVKI